MKKHKQLKQKLMELRRLVISEKKTLSRTKHDVLEKELRVNKIKAIYYYMKMLMLENKISENKLTTEQLNKESVKILNNIFPFILISAHMVYENYLDSKKINIEISEKYLKNIEYSIKLLLLVALLEHKNIYLKDIKDSKKLLQILEGKINSELSDLIQTNINVYNLNKEYQQILDNYHQKYMKTNVYNKILSNKPNKIKVKRLHQKIISKNIPE